MADSPQGLAYAETPLLSPGSPVESTCTCPGQLMWLVALKLIKEEELPGHFLIELMTSALFSSDFHDHLYAIIIQQYMHKINQ